MRKRAAVVLAVLIGLLAPAAPASAAAPLTVSGRVLDEAGRPVAGATVRAWVTLHLEVEEHGPGLLDAFFWGLGCIFSFGFACDADRTENVGAVARTDRNGRYVLRFPGYDTTWEIVSGVANDVEITAPTLVRGTEPATTSTAVAPVTRATMPTFRLWLRGATVYAVSPTRRRLRAGVPSVLGRPVRPASVTLLDGYRPVWHYGEVARDRDVDSRVVEDGTTGTRSVVTTIAGSMRISYRSGVRPVSKAAVPLSRGKRCYADHVLLGRQIQGCPLTEGDLADESHVTYSTVVVDLGELSVPEAYVVRHCDVVAVDTSLDGVVYQSVRTEEKERRVHTGRPGLPARYVRLRLDYCRLAEVSVFGRPYELPLPKAPVVSRAPAEGPRKAGDAVPPVSRPPVPDVPDVVIEVPCPDLVPERGVACERVSAGGARRVVERTTAFEPATLTLAR